MWFGKKEKTENWKEHETIKTNDELLPLFLKFKEENISEQKIKDDIRKNQELIDEEKSLEYIEKVDVPEEFRKYLVPFNKSMAMIRVPYLKHDIVVYTYSDKKKEKQRFYYRGTMDTSDTLYGLIKEIVGTKNVETQ